MRFARGEQARRYDAGLLGMLSIRDKGARTLPFRLNRGQRRLYEAAARQRAAGRPVRIVCLKARQFGGSTLFESLLFCDAHFRRDRENWIVAHSLRSSENLMEMSRRFHRHLPDELRYEARRSNAGELCFENGSRIAIDTAGNLDAGRSFTIHCLHASEVAFWPHADTLLLALLQAAPDTADSAVFIESTANGLGGAFYRLWRDAREGRGMFEGVFVGWNDVEEYTTEFGSSEERTAFEDSLSDAERALGALHRLTLEQLHWRRRTLDTKCGGDADRFRQEYPLDDMEAFVGSGRPVFESAGLMRRYHAVGAPALRGEIGEDGVAEMGGGRFSVWVPPSPGGAYVLGVDVAQGVERDAGRREPDRSCIQVLDRRTLEQAACWTGHAAPDCLGVIARDVGRYYNDALAAVEANNHGLTTLTELLRIYNNIYYRAGGGGRSAAGWLTTSRTRPLMLNGLGRALREESLTLNDGETIAECLSFVTDQDGRPGALPGCYDDRVMALAIALAAHQEWPMPRGGDTEDDIEKRLRTLARLRSGGRGVAVDGWTAL